MFKKIIKILSILFLFYGFFFPSFTIYKKEREKKEEKIVLEIKEKNLNYYAILEIPKINLKKELYEINNQKNQVDKNIYVHPSSIFPNKVILASHSGYSSIAYFQKLYLLNKKDQVFLYYNNKKYIYEISDIEEQEKTGILYLKEFPLVLITCTKNNNKTQTIYYGALKSVKNVSN